MMGKYEEFTGDLAVIGSDEVFSLEIGVNPFLYGNELKRSILLAMQVALALRRMKRSLNKDSRR